MSIRDLKKINCFISLERIRVCSQGGLPGMPSVWSWVYEKVMIRAIINGGWDSFYDQSIQHKINNHPVMTVINDGAQLMGMSEEENMTVRHVCGVAA